MEENSDTKKTFKSTLVQIDSESLLLDPFHCGDCGDPFEEKKHRRRSDDMPFLCETCAKYRQGGY